MFFTYFDQYIGIPLVVHHFFYFKVCTLNSWHDVHDTIFTRVLQNLHLHSVLFNISPSIRIRLNVSLRRLFFLSFKIRHIYSSPFHPFFRVTGESYIFTLVSRRSYQNRSLRIIQTTEPVQIPEVCRTWLFYFYTDVRFLSLNRVHRDT